jgi:hypothetical protein
MFRFKITENGISFLNVYWEGFGWYSGISVNHYQAYLYIFNVTSNSWELFGSNSTDIKPGDSGDFIQNCSITDGAHHYIDSSDHIHILMEGPQVMDSSSYTDLYTDVIKVYTLAKVTVYPTGPSLDVGDDGDIEWSTSGTFDMKMVIDDNKFKTELQSLVDAAEPGVGVVEIPLKFTSTTEGKIKITNISIDYELNYAPDLHQVFQNGTYGFFEDSNDGGNNLVDLNDYFWDDNDNGSLIFSILKNGDNIHAEIDPDGYHLDFTSDPDYYGTEEFQIRAIDLGFDGIPGGDTDLYTDSNIFTVTVWPTNDAPVIDFVGSMANTGGNKPIEFKGTNGAEEDTWFEIDISGHDIDDDSLVYSVNQTWESPAVIQLVPDIVDDNIGKLSILPTNEHVGLLYLNISVSDNNETGSTQTVNPSKGPLSDSVEILIEISNQNDAPVFETITDQEGYEDTWLNFSLIVKDEDIVHGDRLKFTSNLTDEIDGLTKNENYAFDKETGEVSILANNEMVGIYWVNFGVEDLEGESDQITTKITIYNVNDIPVPVISTPLHQEVFNTTVLIYFDGANSTDDDLIHGDSLTYTWHSDQTGALSTESKFSTTLTDIGWHNITLTVKDIEKKEVESVISIKIAPAASGDGPGGDDPGDDPGTDPDPSNEPESDEDTFEASTGLFIFAILVVIIIIAALGIFLWQRKRTEEEFARELEEEAQLAQLEAEQLQMIQPPQVQVQQPMQPIPPVMPPPQTQLPPIPPPPQQPQQPYQ